MFKVDSGGKRIMSTSELISKKRESISEQDLRKLIALLETVNYGSITLVIQDGKVIQIEKHEKMRLK